MAKNIILIFIILLLSPLALAKTTNDYFNDATAMYITGDLAGAALELEQLLGQTPGHQGAAALLKSIEREQKAQAFSEAAEPILPAPQPGLKIDYLVGLFILANLFGFLAIFGLASLSWRWFSKKGMSGETEKCFHCGAKIRPDTDVCPYCGVRVAAKAWHAVSEEQKLWYSKIKWHRNPFSLDVHSELFTGYKKEVKEVLSKISARSGHVLIVGDLGVGKTTMLRWLSNNLPKDINPIYVPRPPQDFNQLIRFISDSVGFSPKNAQDYNIYNLNRFCRKLKKGLVLLLDEAHEFTVEVERPLRTLGDLDDVMLVMGGLPETVDKFKKEIPPLYERLVLKIALNHLVQEDLEELIRVRIEEAGGTGLHPFTADAIKKIFELSEGIPRRALKLCDQAVTAAINNGEDKVTPALIN